MAYPKYIQNRIDANNTRIKEIKKILLDEDSLELYEEIVFLKTEITNLMSTNYMIQTYTEPLVTDENAPISIINVPVDKIGSQLESEAKIEFGEYLYKIDNSKENDYVPEDDAAIFKRYGIQFVNGLPVNVDVDNTPPFVINKIRNLSVTDRLAISKDKKFHESDYWSGTDKIEKIFFESEIDGETFKDILKLDTTVEDKSTIKEYSGKEYILVQLKPDYAISGDFRYTLIEKTKGFEKYYVKLKDKTEDFGTPTYKRK